MPTDRRGTHPLDGHAHRGTHRAGSWSAVSSIASGVSRKDFASRPPPPWKVQQPLTHRGEEDTSCGPFRGSLRRGKTLPPSRLGARGKQEQQGRRERGDGCCRGDAWRAFADADAFLQIAASVGCHLVTP